MSLLYYYTKNDKSNHPGNSKVWSRVYTIPSWTPDRGGEQQIAPFLDIVCVRLLKTNLASPSFTKKLNAQISPFTSLQVYFCSSKMGKMTERLFCQVDKSLLSHSKQGKRRFPIVPASLMFDVLCLSVSELSLLLCFSAD